MNKALKILLLVLLLCIVVLAILVGPNLEPLFGSSVPGASPSAPPGVDKPLTLSDVHIFF